MKTCPKCQSVFTPETVFCLNDGTPLVEENFPRPSSYPLDDEDTLVRSAPIVIDNFNEPEPTPLPPPPVGQFQPAAQSARPNRGIRYLLFLIVGLLIGAGLVGILAVIFIMYRAPGAANAPANFNTANKGANIPAASEKHLARNNTRKDDEFNGIVNTENGNIRAAPNSGVQDILPKGDRIEIIERENPTSPWYRVMCEHGVTGWMHGNTIKFTDDTEAF